MIKEYFKIAIKNLRTRPLRSWLTILGMIMGVFLIMSLLSLSEGLKSTVLRQLRSIGKDIVMVIPGDISDFIATMMGGAKLTEDDLNTIKKTDGVLKVVPFIYKAEGVRAQSKNKTVILSAIDIKNALDVYKEDMGFDLSEGRWPMVGKREVIIGDLVQKQIFPGLKPGDKITIKGKQFDVVGVLKSLGSKLDDSMIGMDSGIFHEITGLKNEPPQAIVKIAPGFSPQEVANNIKSNLSKTIKRKRGEEGRSFSVLTNEAMSGMVSNVMGIIQVAVLSFASIAIVVGGIGIMNTMYTSVRERTREIGILKAVGAKNSTITNIFLIESGIIGLFGGLVGMALGLGLAKIIELVGQVHPIFYIAASISPGLIFFGIAFSFLIGCLSGFLPARSAAKLKPVDALRYE